MSDLPANMQVLFKFWNLSGRVGSHYSAEDNGYSPMETQFLLQLTRPMRAGELAKILNCLPSNITPLVNRFEKQDFLERVRSDEDRRAVSLVLTEQGVAERKRIISRISILIDEQSSLTSDQFQRILAILAEDDSPDEPVHACTGHDFS